ncbi:hypothetical protein RHGRI_023985 [Rhododendron griersonianum]|uniref:Uncharacterized protein n=1 Tax=Rhododendron griersonianum TaxID=479676 RepID=A0AAV6J5X6_9ERIC|nr:hypothetical protein RHGRI_023985 [Rhododendron griersonianum]
MHLQRNHRRSKLGSLPPVFRIAWCCTVDLVYLQSTRGPNSTPDNHKVDCASKPSSPAAHSTEKELSVSEDQLLEILGGVVSSNQAQGELKQHIKSLTSQSKGHSEPDYSLAPEPPDQLGSSSKEGADLVSKGSTGFNEYFSNYATGFLRALDAGQECLSDSSAVLLCSLILRFSESAVLLDS